MITKYRTSNAEYPSTEPQGNSKLDPNFQALSKENEQLRKENENIKREMEMHKRKVQELEARKNFMDDQVWDLRKLVKRVGREGYLQITEVEKEKKKLEDDYNSLKLAHECLETNATTIERCVGYWKYAINESKN